MRFTLSALALALFAATCLGAQAFQVRMVPFHRALTPKMVSSIMSPDSRLDRALRDPFALFDALARDDFFHSLQPLLKRANELATGPTAMGAVASFKVDVTETDKAYQIHADLPGCRKEDVKVVFQDGVLEISAERKQEQRSEQPAAAPTSEGHQAVEGQPAAKEGEAAADKEGNVRYFMSEVVYGSFYRSFRLPNDADSENIRASFENGVLSVELNKKQPATKKTVEIA